MDFSSKATYSMGVYCFKVDAGNSFVCGRQIEYFVMWCTMEKHSISSTLSYSLEESHRSDWQTKGRVGQGKKNSEYIEWLWDLRAALCGVRQLPWLSCDLDKESSMTESAKLGLGRILSQQKITFTWYFSLYWLLYINNSAEVGSTWLILNCF